MLDFSRGNLAADRVLEVVGAARQAELAATAVLMRVAETPAVEEAAGQSAATGAMAVLARRGLHQAAAVVAAAVAARVAPTRMSALRVPRGLTALAEPPIPVARPADKAIPRPGALVPEEAAGVVASARP
jgi:hypothetical protein